MSEEQVTANVPEKGNIYRRAKLWQIICYSFSAFPLMGAYILIGYASYSASIGYGISTAIIGVILMGTRILDAVTDPMLAFVYDKVNTKHGKLRILLLMGFAVQTLGFLWMYIIFSSKGFGIAMFCIGYVIYILGYTMINMTSQTLPAILTNDPKQRPQVGVWQTIFNYLVPMMLTMLLNVVILKQCGGTFNQQFLTTSCLCVTVIGLIGVIIMCIGVTPYDKPEYYGGLTRKREPLKWKDIFAVLKNNKPLQCYIASAASDKLAQQVASQSIIVTLLYGIVIGNIQLSTILSVISMLPSILFAAFGAKYVGKRGGRDGIIHFSFICIIVTTVIIVFFTVIDPTKIAQAGPIMILYVILMVCLNGSKMCVTTCNNSFMADIIDYELDRSGKYIPAVVTGTYSLIDKLVSSLSSVIATGCVAFLGYRNSVPQPGDASTPQLFWMTMFLFFMLPIIGWIITEIAMKKCDLSREKMAEVQERIAAKKQAMKAEAEQKA